MKESRERERIHNQKQYARRRGLGLCGTCGRPVVMGKASCQKCIQRRTNLKRKATERGLCRDCGLASELGKSRCRTCLDRKLAIYRERYRGQYNSSESYSKAKRAEFRPCKCRGETEWIPRVHARKCLDCGGHWYPTTEDRKKAKKPRVSEWQKRRRRELKSRILGHYSNGTPKCACCGESHLIFLALDHINENGAEHRKSIHSGRFYQWIAKNGFPKGFQVLCHNCNWAKSRGGCPHGSPAGQALAPGEIVVSEAS